MPDEEGLTPHPRPRRALWILFMGPAIWSEKFSKASCLLFFPGFLGSLFHFLVATLHSGGASGRSFLFEYFRCDGVDSVKNKL